MGLLDELGVKKDDYEKIEDQGIGGNMWSAGVYAVVVDEAFIRKTEKGAKMLELRLLDQEGKKLNYSTCTHSGDAKGNKETFGIHNLKHFLQAIGIEDPTVVTAPVKFKDKEVDALCMTNVQGKKLIIGVIEDQSWGDDGTEYLKNDISHFLDVNGKNAKGEDLADEIAAKIEERPRKIQKAKANAGTPAQSAGDKDAMAKSGWGSK